jgi:hypothetical protein
MNNSSHIQDLSDFLMETQLILVDTCGNEEHVFILEERFAASFSDQDIECSLLLLSTVVVDVDNQCITASTK